MRLLVVAAALLTLAGCSSAPAPAPAAAPASTDSCRGSGCSLTLAPQNDPMLGVAQSPAPAVEPAVDLLQRQQRYLAAVRGDSKISINERTLADSVLVVFAVSACGAWSRGVGTLALLDIGKTHGLNEGDDMFLLDHAHVEYCPDVTIPPI